MSPMRSKVPCRFPGCPTLVPGGTGGYCQEHEGIKKQRYKDYDNKSRDKQSADFYNSPAWRRLRKMKMQQNPLCERCYKDAGRIIPATIVHHRVEVKQDWSRRLSMDNLISVCDSCHAHIHGGKD